MEVGADLGDSGHHGEDLAEVLFGGVVGDELDPLDSGDLGDGGEDVGQAVGLGGGLVFV